MAAAGVFDAPSSSNAGGNDVGSTASSSPSASQIPSEAQSRAPSVAPTLVSDRCTGARTLIVTFPFVDSSGQYELAAELGDGSQATVCSLGCSFDRGLWYRIEGIGSCMRATTTGVNQNTILSAYEGSCEQLACVAESDGEGTPALAVGSQITWKTQKDTSYFILVGHVRSNAVGENTLLVEVSSKCCNGVKVDIGVILLRSNSLLDDVNAKYR